MSRVILKISGEALKIGNNLIADEKLEIILKTIEILKKDNHKIGIVIGGGNFFRGREHNEMEKVTRDTIGMLGTVTNALYIKDFLSKKNINSIISTPFNFPNLIENYTNNELNEKYENGEIILFGGGIGKSGYSTDSGTILASEILNCDLIIKMTNVDGVYDGDPKIMKDAKKFSKLTYDEVIKNNYKVMDQYAIEKCKENGIKILVINYSDYEGIKKYFDGKIIGTLIGE